MRTILAARCVRRTPPPSTDITVWARAVVADPVRYGATPREAAIVSSLLRQVSR